MLPFLWRASSSRMSTRFAAQSLNREFQTKPFSHSNASEPNKRVPVKFLLFTFTYLLMHDIAIGNLLVSLSARRWTFRLFPGFFVCAVPGRRCITMLYKMPVQFSRPVNRENLAEIDRRLLNELPASGPSKKWPMTAATDCG